MRPAKLSLLCVVVTAAIVSAAQAEEYLYALSNATNPNLLKLDPTTGAILESHPVTNEEALFGGLAADAAMDLYSIDGYNDANSDRAFRIDRTTGAGTVVGDTGYNWNFRYVYAHPITDVLYSGRDNELYTIDRATGAATSVAPITGATLDQTTALAIDSQGNAYITDIGDLGLFSLDLATGQATHIGNMSSGYSTHFKDLAFNSNDVLHGGRSDGGVYTIDTTNATMTFKFSGNRTGLTFVVEGPECPGDVDGDGDTDLSDLAELLAAYGTSSGDPDYNADADFDDNGEINLSDLAFLLSDYGCQP